jgi:hypothetical protein
MVAWQDRFAVARTGFAIPKKIVTLATATRGEASGGVPKQELIFCQLFMTRPSAALMARSV